MTDLDRLLELKERYSILDNIGKTLSSSEFQEFKSLYEKLKKADIQSEDYKIILDLLGLELPKTDTDRGHIFQNIKQNQKTQEDIEKIKKYDEMKYHYESNYDKAVKYFPTLTEKQYEEFSSLSTILTWIANELADQTGLEKEIQKLSEDNKQLKEEIIILKSASSYDAKSIIKLQQDSKTNAEIVERLRDFVNQSDFESPDDAVDYLHILPKLQSILKETK